MGKNEGSDEFGANFSLAWYGLILLLLSFGKTSKEILIEMCFLVVFELSSCLQSFSESPRNMSLRQGEDVVLKCAVKGQRGLKRIFKTLCLLKCMHLVRF